MKDTFVGFYKKKCVRDINEKNSILLFGLPIDRKKDTPGRSKRAPKAIRRHSYEFSGVSMEYDIVKSKSAYY